MKNVDMVLMTKQSLRRFKICFCNLHPLLVIKDNIDFFFLVLVLSWIFGGLAVDKCIKIYLILKV